MSRNFSDKRSAEAWAAQMAVEMGNGSGIPDSRITLAQFLDRWLQDQKPRVAPTTLVRYHDFARLYVKPALGHVRLSKLGPQLIQSFYTAKLTNDNLSAGTVLLLHRYLSKVLRDATRMGVLGRNPVALVDAPKRSTFQATIWDPEQARLFLGEAKRTSPYYGLYLFSATTAVRPGEALALRWDDVNLPLQTADIRRKVYRHTAKQRELCGLDTALVVSAPKTKNAIRTIPLISVMVEELRRLQRKQAEHKKLFGDAYEGNGLVFCTTHGRFLDMGGVIRRDFNEIVKQLKLPKIRYYDLRHSAASYLIALGVDVQTVSNLMGHGSAAFTLSRYVHDIPSTKVDAMRRRESSLFGTANTGTEVSR